MTQHSSTCLLQLEEVRIFWCGVVLRSMFELVATALLPAAGLQVRRPYHHTEESAESVKRIAKTLELRECRRSI